jgi:Holliday junction resolvase RusA-like endonuclease
MIIFNLPKPPSTNRLYKRVLNAKGRRPYTKEYTDWHNRAAWAVATQRLGQQKRIEGRYILTFTLGRCKLDIGNAEKAVSDLLQHMGVIRNDRDAEEIRLKWGDIEGCRVELNEAPTSKTP